MAARISLSFFVYFTNHGFYSAKSFKTLEEAVAYAKSVCFESSIVYDGKTVASWSPIGGLRTYA